MGAGCAEWLVCSDAGWTAPGEGPGGHTGARALFGLPRNNHGVLSQGTTKGSRAGHRGTRGGPLRGTGKRELWLDRAREGWGACGGRVGSIVDGLDLGERKWGTERGSAF